MNWSRFSWPGTKIRDSRDSEYCYRDYNCIGHRWNVLFTEQYIAKENSKEIQRLEDEALIEALVGGK